MADWQRIQSHAMLRDLDGGRYPSSSETDRRRHLLRLQQDIDHAITDSLVSAPTEDDMDIVRHLMRQNKRLREHGLTLREQVHRKEHIYRARIADKRHETKAFEDMIDDLERANERLKDYYELYKGTGVHLDPAALRRKREEGPAVIPAHRRNVYDRYRRAYPSSQPEPSKKTLADMVQMKTLLREKSVRGELAPSKGDDMKKMRSQMELLKLEKDKMVKDISTLSSKKPGKISLPKGTTLTDPKDKLSELAMLKLMSQKKGRKLDLDESSDDSEMYDSTSESESDVAEKWKRLKEDKYKKLRKMSDAVETIHGESPKEFKDRRKRRQNIELSKKKRNAGVTAGQVEEITQRLKELEERSAKVIAQKSRIDSLIEQHKQQQQQADDFSEDED